MNGRVYDPQTAMFFSPDPLVQAPGDWLNYNRYGYCFNNPLIYTDPSGYKVREANDNYRYDPVLTTDIGNFTPSLFLTGYLSGLRSGGGGAVPYTFEGNTYFDSSGNIASFNDVTNNYLLPRATYIESYSGNSAQTVLNTYQNGFSLYSIKFASGYTSYAASIGDIGKATMDSNGGLTFTNPTAAGTSIGLWGGESPWAATATDWLNNVAGGLGTGMGKLSGTFRLTNGIYNGSDLSIKYYSSGWNGGSRAGIATYNAVEWGSKIGKASILVSAGLGAYNIYNGIQKDGGTYGLNAQVATGQTIGGIGGGMAGAEIGVMFQIWR